MSPDQTWTRLGRDLFRFADACNVYLLRYGERAIAVDFGSGAWLARLDEIGVERLEHVVLTHAHRDQCYGLYRGGVQGFTVHAPAADAPFLRPDALRAFWDTYQANGCPASYAAPCLPLENARTDMAADTETRLGPARFCSIATPGHTPGALTYIVEWRSRHLAFCGDAVRAGAALHQPYHLEWDHWTPSGTLAAWHGLERLGYCYFDLLLPAHGPVVRQRPRACVRQTQKRLMDLIRVKGSVCAGEKNRWCDLEPMACGARRVLPRLYHFGTNSFLLVSERGEGLVVDPQLADIDQLGPLLQEIGLRRISAATASHYHLDHSDGLNHLRDRRGAQVWLHPWVAAPVRDRNRYDLPWLPAESIVPDRLLPEQGAFRWCEYRFGIHPLPGQTWWHCAFHTRLDGRSVLFAGDNFQPPTRWNGTGGFCAFNQSRFREGFARSAQTVLDIAPDIICSGHGGIYRFAPDHYRRIRRWSEKAEKAVRALCPSTPWLADYDPRAARWEPFVHQAKPGQRLPLTLIFSNYRRKKINLTAAPVGPRGWHAAPARRRVGIPKDAERRMRFTIEVPRRTEKGRYLVAADVEADDRLLGEVCVAIIDVEGGRRTVPGAVPVETPL